MLSAAASTKIAVESLFDEVDFCKTLARAEFEQLCMDLFSQTMDKVETTLSDAKLRKADIHEILLVGGSTRIPKVQSMLQDFFNGRDLQRSINPDEAVAYGAAVLAAKLSGNMSKLMENLMLYEVTPLSLGWKDCYGAMVTVIKRNTRIPTKRTCSSQTASDNQTSVRTSIFEGERAMAKDNNFLGEFLVQGFPAKPRGEINITITKYKGHLSEEEAKLMLAEAEKFKQEDEKERSRVAAMNALLDCIYSTKRKLEKVEVKQKMSEKNRKMLLAKCEESIKWADREKQATKEDYERKRKQFESECSL
ncbi:heat shock protein 70 [Echinococcus multilocularis]|uniref:Heat shock protein 70 n=1 Tax=Echinococcus multilocularis TaxID=6211 RepID=A0A087VWV9_ECHMU|nr:heat shock protein 70 [Echinococcus multilocularis]